MNIKNENDFVVKVQTPTSCISQHISLGGYKSRSLSRHSKSPNVQRSSNSMSYSDSFDNDSPVKAPIKKKTKIIKEKSHKTSTFFRKTKINARVTSLVLKPNETTKKLLEANKIKINELLSENADCHRQLLEKAKELKTLQNQNRIQENYLKKVNNRDADVPNLISRFNAEIHSLQELLRRNKEKLDLSNRQKKDTENDLNKLKMKNERLTSLCDNKELQEKDDLMKKIRSLNELLEAEAKKHTDMERTMELMAKKHAHRMSIEANKFKELNLTYKDIVNEVRDVRNILKEKTKLLEMQSIYNKMALKPPHHLGNTANEMGDNEDPRCSVRKGEQISAIKTALKREEKDATSRCNQNISNAVKPSILKKTTPPSKLVPEVDWKHQKGTIGLKNKSMDIYSSDTCPEVQEVKEKCEKQDRFSDLHETVLRNMKEREKSDKEISYKNNLLSKLKQIDESRAVSTGSPSETTQERNHVEENDRDNKRDESYSSEGEDQSTESVNSETSSSFFLPKVSSSNLNSSHKQSEDQRRSQLSKLDFLGYSLNNNSNNNYGRGAMERRVSRLSESDEE